LVPLVFLLALLVGSVLGIVLTWWPLVVLASLYAVFALSFSFHDFWRTSRQNPFFLLLPLIFLSLHLSYGAGTLWGIIRGAFSRKSFL